MVSTNVFISWFLLTRYNVITTKPLDLPKHCVYNSINTLKENYYMRKSTRSILQELSDVGLHRDPNLVIESRGSNIIQSAINLLEMIRESYDIETATELERRFINAIKANDPAKFKRGIKRIQESKNDTK